MHSHSLGWERCLSHSHSRGWEPSHLEKARGCLQGEGGQGEAAEEQKQPILTSLLLAVYDYLCDIYEIRLYFYFSN